MRLAGADIDPTAIVFSDCVIGEGPLRLGPGAVVGHSCFFDCAGGIELAAGAGVAPGVRIFTSDHEMGGAEKRHGRIVLKPVRIGEGCWVGANAVILPGVRIAPGCVIGAGAVVHRDTEPDGIYAGLPARRIRDIEPARDTGDRPADSETSPTLLLDREQLQGRAAGEH